MFVWYVRSRIPIYLYFCVNKPNYYVNFVLIYVKIYNKKKKKKTDLNCRLYFRRRIEKKERRIENMKSTVLFLYLLC
jgi:hypothetical protein